MSISLCKEKNVVVLYFLNAGFSPIVSSNETCRERFFQSQRINLNTSIFCITDEMLLENGSKIRKEIQLLLNRDCTEFIIRMIDVTPVREAFVDSLKFDPRHTFLYFSPSDNTSVLQVCSKFKIINILEANILFEEEIHSSDSLLCEQNILYYPSEYLQNDRTIGKLECMSWYIHYLKKAFECASGRLLQLSGTCFLNTIINGLFLSAGTQALFLHLYKKSLAEGYVYKESIETLSCPSETTRNSKKFILTLVDAILSKRKRLRKKTLDIMTHASASSFSTQESSGGGGSPLFAILEILHSFQINYRLKLAQKYEKKISSSYAPEDIFLSTSVSHDPKVQYVFPYPLPRRDFYYYFSSARLEEYLKTFYRPELDSVQDVDILIEYQPVTQLRDMPEIIYNDSLDVAKTILERQGIQYQLQFCYVEIAFQSIHHAVVGINCNGIFQLFDSSTNRFFQFDWQTMKKNVQFIHELEHIFSEKVTKYTREFCVYMRSDSIRALQSQPVLQPTEDIF